VLAPRRTLDGLPTPSAALLLFAIILPVAFYGSAYFSDSTGATLITLVVQVLGILLPAVLIVAVLRLSPRATFSLRLPSPAVLAPAALIGLTAWVVSYGLVVRLLPAPESYEQATEKALKALNAELGLAGMLLLIAVLPAIGEELAFRGVMLRGLSRLGPAWAIALSSLLFGLAHGDMYRLAPATLMGVLNAWVVWRTGSIFPAMTIHFLNNGAAVLLAVLVVDVTSLPAPIWDGSYPAWPVVLAAIAAVSSGLLWMHRLTAKRSAISHQPSADEGHGNLDLAEKRSVTHTPS
jgi:sodium transport system permease protein